MYGLKVIKSGSSSDCICFLKMWLNDVIDEQEGDFPMATWMFS